MTRQINLVTLGVDDLDEAILFYEDALGLPSMTQEGNVAIFNLSSSWLALLPKGALIEDGQWITPQNGSKVQSLSLLSHYVTSKAEVDAVISHAVEAGAKLYKKPTDLPTGEYLGYFTDLYGHFWQVVWNPYYSTQQDYQIEYYSLPH